MGVSSNDSSTIQSWRVSLNPVSLSGLDYRWGLLIFDAMEVSFKVSSFLVHTHPGALWRKIWERGIGICPNIPRIQEQYTYINELLQTFSSSSIAPPQLSETSVYWWCWNFDSIIDPCHHLLVIVFFTQVCLFVCLLGYIIWWSVWLDWVLLVYMTRQVIRLGLTDHLSSPSKGQRGVLQLMPSQYSGSHA